MEAVGISIISKEGERRRCLPLEIRLQMYDDVHKLRKKGLSHRQIQKKIYEKYGKRISLAQICFWINKKHHPLGNINKFNDKPSPELAYVIGTKLGDGSIFSYSKHHGIRLKVNDKEFAEEFGRCLAKVLRRKEPYKPFWSKKHKQWIVEACSIQLYKFLDRPLEELKPNIEYSKKTVSAFLRALFDGEGSMYVNKEYHSRRLELYNANIELLNYTRYLLKEYFKIDSTKPRISAKKGEKRYFPDRKYYSKSTKNCYCLYIRTNSLLNFYKHIGFTIKRKQQRLIEAIQ
ncbi:MAG: LAGLIDADG family homing endonuclease [Nitrososphaerota archaeon]